MDRFSAPVSSESSSPLASEGVWKERQEAEEALKKYLAEAATETREMMVLSRELELKEANAKAKL